ncbi:hypothetical protein [Natrononativus amylolyticus]|uniref:hypothetical protein n=1 Tax=Natrononativus amylolyticus TaxID=2963434 RepID=UPI0020CE386E|nr:hypothetical protein [Natrononativus amylolyticus]
MSDRKPNNPLSPYYPSETPDLSGNVHRWIAIGVLLWAAFWGGWILLATLEIVSPPL